MNDTKDANGKTESEAGNQTADMDPLTVVDVVEKKKASKKATNFKTVLERPDKEKDDTKVTVKTTDNLPFNMGDVVQLSQVARQSLLGDE